MAFDFPTLKNDLIIRVIRGESVGKTPIWIMRQAGRYLPEFRKVREKYDFFKIVQTPELCCEITMQPILRYNLDAAIIFSDILIICQSMGMHVDMVNGQGPVFASPLQSPNDFGRLILEVDVIASMGYLLEAITLTRKKLDGRCPLVGFCGAPWTLMCYMTDTSNNGGAKNYNSSRRWLYKYPEQSRFLLGKIATIVGNLLAEQARAGAQILMVFDSHAGVLNRQLFNYFLMGPLTEIIRIVKESNISVPLIYFAKGGHYVINELLETQFDVIALDWSIEPREIKSTNKTLMGNLDPAALYGSKDQIKVEVRRVIESFKQHKHIFNLGHGIYPDIDPESVQTIIDEIRRINI